MKKISAAVLAALILLSAVSLTSCGKKAEKADDADVTPAAADATPTAAASESAAPTLAPEDTGQLSSTIEKVTAPPEDEARNEDSVEKDFSGIWKANASTTQNSTLDSLELEITYTDYSVTMSFSSGSVPTVEYAGTYKIKDGTLIFDKNFDGCTAYFSADDKDTLILDNGNSLIYCEREAEDERD